MTSIFNMSTEKVKTVSIPHVFHLTDLDADVKSADYLKQPRWFVFSEYGHSENKDFLPLFLRYEVKKPLTLFYGSKCEPREGLDGYVISEGYTYIVHLFRPSECLNPEFVHIKNPKDYTDAASIKADVKAIKKMLGVTKRFT